MNRSIENSNTEIIDHAMAEYLLDAIAAKNKHKKIRLNMECRRKLEIKLEERKLKRDILEFDFNFN